VDYDLVAVLHAQALLADGRREVVAVGGDMRDPEAILVHDGIRAAGFDPDAPACVVLAGAPARCSPTISWGYQTARCSGSVTARHTFSRECASLRVNVSVHRSPSRVSVPRAASTPRRERECQASSEARVSVSSGTAQISTTPGDRL